MFQTRKHRERVRPVEHRFDTFRSDNPCFGFVYYLIIYSSYIIQVIACFYQTVFDRRIYFLHQWEQVEADFIAGIFVFQIGAVCYEVLSDLLQVADDFFPVDAEQRTYDCSVSGRIPNKPVMPVPRMRLSSIVSTLSSGGELRRLHGLRTLLLSFRTSYSGVPGCHFYRDPFFSCVLSRVEVDGMQADAVFLAKLPDKLFVTV